MDKKQIGAIILASVLISVAASWYFFTYIPRRFDRELRYYRGREEVIIDYSLPYEFDMEHVKYVSRNELRQAVDDMSLRDPHVLMSAMRYEKALIVVYYDVDGTWFYLWDAR